MLRAALSAFAVVFPAELPDKTMITTVVLVARYRRPGAVWAGAAGAFAVHVVVAVSAGRLLALLPTAAVRLVVAVLFMAGAVLLWRAGNEAAQPDAEGSPSSARAAFLGTFGVILLAEWGDLTQLATASLAATTSAPVGVGLGALAALWAVAGLATVFGTRLLGWVDPVVLHRVAAVIFGVLAFVALFEAVAG